MQPNPILTKLGLSTSDRAVIIHADDIGMCHASLAAYSDLLNFGLISSASTMVPCAWFPATAAFCDENNSKVDMGVHITLTCEQVPYRWRPVSTCDPTSGLLDTAGYFHPSPDALQKSATQTAIQIEIQAQIERALNAGIDVTHIDAHQFAATHPRFFNDYLQAALKFRLPLFLLRQSAADLQKTAPGWLDEQKAAFFARYLHTLEEQGLPLFDHFYLLPLKTADNRLEHIKHLLATLPPGITYLIIHPAQDTAELRALTPDWQARVADYRAFVDPSMRTIFQNAGIHIIGWRVLRELARQAN
ncbi:MAG: polysaccharide deacetylase family protein [Anaerolineae bacterium]|nr:polysaccharide deacetylase family protein [Anaerolineae bacterium]